MKKIFLFFLSFLFFYSCSSTDDTKQECRIKLTEYIENQRYEEALNLLESEECKFSKEEKIINKGVILSLQTGIDYKEVVKDLSELWFVDIPFRKSLVKFSNNASKEHISKMEDLLELYSSIDDKKTILEFCEKNRKNLTLEQRDICFYASISSLFKGIDEFTLSLSGLGGSNARQVANKFLFQVKRDTFCSEDVNKNGVIDEADALICAYNYSQNNSCDSIPNTSVSTKDITIIKDGKEHQFKLLKITVDKNTEQCSGYSKRMFYKLYSKEKRKIVITDGYCDSNYNTCNEPDENSCFPCPVINEDFITFPQTLVHDINTAYRLMWTSFKKPTDSEMVLTFRNMLKEICSSNIEDCYCGRHQCEEDDIEVVEVRLFITEQALVNYLSTHYEEED